MGPFLCQLLFEEVCLTKLFNQRGIKLGGFELHHKVIQGSVIQTERPGTFGQSPLLKKPSEDKYCFDFNMRRCTRSRCPYKHNCMRCNEVDMGSQHVRRAIKHKCFGTNCSAMENCLCCKYPSPVKFDEILPLLNEYPKKSLAKILIKGFTTGFKLGYSGNHI